MLDKLSMREVIDRDDAQLLAAADRDDVADAPVRNGSHENRRIGRLTVRQMEQVADTRRRYRASVRSAARRLAVAVRAARAVRVVARVRHAEQTSY